MTLSLELLIGLVAGIAIAVIGLLIMRGRPALPKLKGAQPAAARGYVEHAAFLGGHDDQVLEESLGLDIGGQFLDEEVAVVFADVGFGQAQLAERDQLDVVHGGAPESRIWPSPSAHPFQPPSPQRFQDRPNSRARRCVSVSRARWHEA